MSESERTRTSLPAGVSSHDEHRRDLEALCTIAAVGSNPPLDEGLRQAVGIVVERLGAAAGAIFVADERGTLRLRATHNVPAALAEQFDEVTATGLDHLLADPERGWTIHAGEEGWEELHSAVRERYDSIGAAALAARGSIIGALFVGMAERRLDAAGMLFLITAGRQLGIAIDNARLLEREQRRREQAEALRAAGLTLSARLDLNALLGLVLDQIARVVPSDTSAFFLTQPENAMHLRLVASRGFPHPHQGGEIPPGSHPLLDAVTRSQRTLIIDDVRNDSRWRPGPNTLAVRSWMGIPLLHDGALLGCLTLDRHVPGWYTAEHAQIAASFAAQAALAVANARLHQEARERLERLDAIYHAVQSLTESVDLQTVIDAAAQSAVAHTSFPLAAVILLDPRTRRFDPAATIGLDEGFRERLRALDIDAPELRGTALERAMHTHRAVAGSDAAEQSTSGDVLLPEGVRAYICAPMIAKGRVEGALCVYDRAPHSNLATDRAFLEALASHAAVAIANARLYEAAEENLRQTRALQNLTASLSAGLDLEANLDAALVAAQQLFGADRAAIFLDDPETGERRCFAARGLSESYLAAVARRYRGRTPDLSDLPDHVYIADALIHPRMAELREAIRAEGIRSILFVTLRYHGQPIGMFTLYHDQQRHYTPVELSLARTLAEQTAIALEHARLFAQVRGLAALEERNRLARELHDSVTQSIFSIGLIAQALPPLIAQRPDRAIERVQRLSELAHGALAEMRSLIFQLRPASLEQDGLPLALRRYAAACESRENIRIVVDVHGERRDAPRQEEALFRIVQEALNNIVKHAHATTVEIDLRYAVDEITLSVQDDGVGFVPTTPHESAGHGLGMLSMRERAEELGGTFRIHSAPGAGTRIDVTLPLPKPAAG